MIVVTDHVQQNPGQPGSVFAFRSKIIAQMGVFCGSAKAKKSLLSFFTVNSKRIVFGAVGSQSSAVFELILVIQFAIHIPQSKIAFCLAVKKLRVSIFGFRGRDIRGSIFPAVILRRLQDAGAM